MQVKLHNFLAPQAIYLLSSHDCQLYHSEQDIAHIEVDTLQG